MSGFFLSIYQWAAKNRSLWFLCVAAIVVICGLGALQLEFEEDITKVIPADEELKELNLVIQNSKFAEKLIINLEVEDSIAGNRALTAFADALVDSLGTGLVPGFIYPIKRVSENVEKEVYSFFYDNLPLFLEPEDYVEIESRLSEDGIHQALSSNYKNLVSPAGMLLKEFIIKDPLSLTSIALEKLQSLHKESIYEIEDGYILTRDHHNLLLFIDPVYPANETGKNGEMLEKLDRMIASISKQHPAISVEYFGGACMAVSNANRLKKDIFFSVTIAIIVLIIGLSFFFRRLSVFVLIFLPTAFGIVVALAVLWLVAGKVSLIAMGVGSILIGISIDYPLHFLSHFRAGHSVEKVIRDLALPMFTSAVTTAGAFLCLLFLKSEALNDLGIFVAACIAATALFSLLVLPHLLSKNSQSISSEKGQTSFIDRLARVEFHRKKWLVTLVVVISLVFAFTSFPVDFEGDLNSMNFVTEKLKQAEKNLDRINRHSLKSVLLISTGNDLEDALLSHERQADKLSQLFDDGVVQKYSGVGGLLLSVPLQQEKIKHWQKFWTAERRQKVVADLNTIGPDFKMKEAAFLPFTRFLEREFHPQPIDNFALLKENFLADYLTENEDWNTVTTILRVEEKDKQAVYDAFAEAHNTIIFDRHKMTEKFVEALKVDFDFLAKLSMVMVFAILLITFGRIELALFTFVPMILSWVWSLGIMNLIGMKFNMFNMIISTFIFGLGIDYSIFISRGYLQEHKFGFRNITSFKTSILLSAFTTFVGIGVLIFAEHPALRTIGISAIIGMLAVLITTFTIEPLLFNHFIISQKKRGLYPITLRYFLKTFITYSVLIFEILLLVLLGTIIFTISPLSRKKRRSLFHRLHQIASKIYIRLVIPFKFELINDGNESFKKPGVIICNHQSVIENPLIRMLAPKIVMVTNKWVLNSPIFGLIGRMAGFPAADAGIDSIIDELKENLDDGYFLVVFPEGTRSTTGKIGRFHKGAFYIAEKLQVDIIPLLFHGTGNMISKHAFWGRSSHVTQKVLPRITPDDDRFETQYSKRTKQVKQYMVAEYDKLKREQCNTEYLRDAVISNYYYKGPVLEWYVKIKARLENNFRLLNEHIPREGKILDMGCGYGYITLMLGLISSKREILGIDYDEEKILIANNCHDKNERIDFRAADITDYEIEPYDAYIFCDVLHYLSKTERESLLRECMANLKDGGVIVIRDGNAEMQKQQQRTKLTEFFSTNFGFNKTKGALEFFGVSEIEGYADSLDFELELVGASKVTSNVFMILKRKQVATDAEI